VVGPAKISAPTAAAGRLLDLLLVLLYRWPDGTAGLMVAAVLDQEGFAPELNRNGQGRAGASPHHGRHGCGGRAVLRGLWLNTLAGGCFQLPARLRNLSYLGVAVLAWGAGVLLVGA